MGEHSINETHLVPKSDSRKQIRRSILNEWGWKCAYCDACIKDAPTLDHVVASVNGGLTVRSNMVACCRDCNGKKGNHDVWDWYGRQTFYCALRALAIWRWMLGCPQGAQGVPDGLSGSSLGMPNAILPLCGQTHQGNRLAG